MRPEIMLNLVLAQAAEGAGDESVNGAMSRGVDEVFSLVEALPVEAHAAAGIMLIGGLALWLFGGKILKPIFGIAGFVLGGLVGMIALPAFGSETVLGQPSAVVGAGIGAVIGLVLSLMALKLAIVFAAAIGLAVVGFMGGAIYLSYNPLPDENPPPAFEIDDSDRAADGHLLFENPYTGQKMTLKELTRTLREADSFLGGGGRNAADDSGEEEIEDDANGERFRAIAVRCEAIVRESYDLAKERWNALSARERVLVMGSTFGGLALGLFVGFFMPRKSTAFITALVGSAAWLTAAGLLLEAYVPSVREATDQPPVVWAFIWVFVFLLGLVIQLAGLGGPIPDRKRKKPADDEDDDEEDE